MSKRKDAIGLFWTDLAKVKPPPKAKIKRTPPFPFWLEPTYLPGLEEARAYIPDLFNDLELYQAGLNKQILLFDTECYPNYWLAAFKCPTTGKAVLFEMGSEDPFEDGIPCQTFDLIKFKWVLENFTIVNFNGRKYDFPICSLVLAGYSTQDMWDATCMIIVEQLQAQDVYKRYKTQRLEINQIDLIELTALGPGLKVCAARLHAQRLQDLPFKPGTVLSYDQILIVRRYCVNDLDNTGLLYQDKIPQIELREQTGRQFGIDLRSHSDAQMAEAIISAEMKRIKGKKFLHRTKVESVQPFKYRTPSFIKFNSALMNYVLDTVQQAVFKVDHITGELLMPETIDALDIKMGNCEYKFGLGGMHTHEQNIAHLTDDHNIMIDTDATSYYPYLILNAGMFPKNLGRDFLLIYNGIVVKRVTAKEAGDIIVAECLKIVANGTFGKLGSMWSIMFAPELFIQVTLTGQLCIVMLGERFEFAGIPVTSVNTDGIVVKCPRNKIEQFHAIVKQWEIDTGLKTEETRYKATYSKDINNYIAVYEVPQKGELYKTKGLYSKTNPKKNAVNEVCIDAIKALMTTNTPISQTIQGCKELSKFTTMRNTSKGGGAVKLNADGNHEYLGKVVRWYYANGVEGEIISCNTGNKVARSEGGKPCMDLPAEFPNDVNHQWYVDECYKILKNIGYTAAHGEVVG
jgi:hypothetical protein